MKVRLSGTMRVDYYASAEMDVPDEVAIKGEDAITDWLWDHKADIDWEPEEPDWDSKEDPEDFEWETDD